MLHNSNKKTVNLTNLLDRIIKEKRQNLQAGTYYNKLNLKLIIPSILITGFSSIASFLSASDYVNEDTKKACILAIGILTIISTSLQSIIGSCKFDTKKEAFLTVANKYDELVTKIRFEICNPNEKDFFNKIEEEIYNIKKNCNYLIPLWIVNQYEDDNTNHHINSFTYDNLNSYDNVDRYDNDNDNSDSNNKNFTSEDTPLIETATNYN